MGKADAWIHGNNETIKYTDIHRTVKDSVTTTCQYGPASISLKREELIYSYSDGDVGIVYIVRHGKYEILITTAGQGSVWIVLYQIWEHPCTYEEDNDIDQKHAQIVRYMGQRLKQ